MPRHDDIFDFSPEALKRTQQASYNGITHCYVGTPWPDVIYFFASEVSPSERRQGRAREYFKKLNEHFDATGMTRIAVVMSRGDVPLNELLKFFYSLGIQQLGEIQDADTDHPWVEVVYRPRPLKS